jgi:DNA invertase Pin-like site-specific DNA recombinase
VLLSFAQFEREVIGKRGRDKIAAFKRKGLWVGGPVPLGYRCVARTPTYKSSAIAMTATTQIKMLETFISPLQ